MANITEIKEKTSPQKMEKNKYYYFFELYQHPCLYLQINGDLDNTKEIEVILLKANHSFYKVFNFKKITGNLINHFFQYFNNFKPSHLLETLHEEKTQCIECYYKIIQKHFKVHIHPIEKNTLFLEFMDVSNEINGIRGQKQIEKELLKAKKKEKEASKLKNAFLSNMSHEIRTPMNSIIGYTQLLIKKIKDPVLSGYVQTIKTHSFKLLNLLSDIIDLSKIDSGQLEIVKSTQSLNDFMDELEHSFSSKILEIKDKDITLSVNKGLRDGDDLFTTDELRLQQVMTNLLANALKFTQKGNIEIGYRSCDYTINFYIKDTGIGLSKKEQSIIFDRFKQADSKISFKYGGTGLGLAIAKGIVELMGGQIWVESKKGQGATFQFTLPA